MYRGALISSRPEREETNVPKPNGLGNASLEKTKALVDESGQAPRTLTTPEANRFLNRAPGFLEKRRSSGIDSPRYIQARPNGIVLLSCTEK